MEMENSKNIGLIRNSFLIKVIIFSICFNMIINKPLAVIYNGPASCDSCTDAAAGPLLEKYDIIIAGPNEKVKLREALKMNPEIFIQPGGGDDMKTAWDDVGPFKNDIRNYVSNGGNYIGLCMGGYLAGEFTDDGVADGGYKLLEQSGSYSDAYIDSKNAEFKTTAETVLDFNWEDSNKKIFFQHGPYFSKPLDSSSKIIAYYKNKEIAAMITKFGNGNVAVVGPHPEATEDWFTEYNLNPVNNLDIYLDFIDQCVKFRALQSKFLLLSAAITSLCIFLIFS